MNDATLTVRIRSLSETRERATRRGVRKVLEGEIEDDSGRIKLVIWGDRINDVASAKVNDLVEIINGFVSSFKGVKELNVGVRGNIKKVE
ncbi:MAG: OB-fold nucleic acid binding domain-containing protein [Candidatus Bathyarchaeia archaeon]